MFRRKPLGLDPEPPPQDGIAPWAGSRTPGPITTVAITSGTAPVTAPSLLSSDVSDNDVASFPFAVHDKLYRLRRTDARRTSLQTR